MNVLILGSLKDPKEGELEKFQNACREIGKELAVTGCTVIVGSDNSTTADYYVVDGMSKVAGRHRVIVHYPEIFEEPARGIENKVPFSGDGNQQQLSSIKITRNSHGGSWAVADVAALQQSDVVILIGGLLRCDLLVHLAAHLEKPILAIKIFRGSGEKVWPELKRQYISCGITEDELAAISSVWTKEESSGAVVSAARKLHENNPFRLRTRIPWIVCAALLSSLVSWPAVFFLTKSDHISSEKSVWILSLISVVIGTSGRLIAQPTSSFTYNRLAKDFSFAAFLSFGFIMLAFLNGVLLNGEIKAINVTATPDFMRVSILFSLIALGAGFLTDIAATDFADKLKGLLYKVR